MHQNKKLIHTGSHNLKEYFTKHKKDKNKITIREVSTYKALYHMFDNQTI